MSAAHPAARTAHSFLEFRNDPSNMLLPRLRRLDGNSPANPFVAGKRRDIFPCRQSFAISCQSLSQIGRHFMYYPSGDVLFSHKIILSNQVVS